MLCPMQNCHKVISVQELLQCPENDGCREVACPSCFTTFYAEVKTTHGDPRNIAYIGKKNIKQFCYTAEHVRNTFMLPGPYNVEITAAKQTFFGLILINAQI